MLGSFCLHRAAPAGGVENHHPRSRHRLAQLAPSSIRRKLSALSALFDYLRERNAVAGNPIDGVKRPMCNNNEDSTLALGDAQARKLLDAPSGDTLGSAGRNTFGRSVRVAPLTTAASARDDAHLQTKKLQTNRRKLSAH
jgi:site-specific recombinase XerC